MAGVVEAWPPPCAPLQHRQLAAVGTQTVRARGCRSRSRTGTRCVCVIVVGGEEVACLGFVLRDAFADVGWCVCVSGERGRDGCAPRVWASLSACESGHMPTTLPICAGTSSYIFKGDGFVADLGARFQSTVCAVAQRCGMQWGRICASRSRGRVRQQHAARSVLHVAGWGWLGALSTQENVLRHRRSWHPHRQTPALRNQASYVGETVEGKRLLRSVVDCVCVQQRMCVHHVDVAPCA